MVPCIVARMTTTATISPIDLRPGMTIVRSRYRPDGEPFTTEHAVTAVGATEDRNRPAVVALCGDRAFTFKMTDHVAIVAG